MSKSKNEIIRIQVKDGFDPLVQYTSNEKKHSSSKKNISNSSDPILTNEKNFIEDKLLDNSLSNEMSHVFDINTQISIVQERKALNQPTNNINTVVNKNENIIKNKIEEVHIRTNENPFTKETSYSNKSNEFDKNYIIKNCNLLRSESIVMYENANYRYEDTEKDGIIVVTEYRLIFIFAIKEEEYIYFQLLSILKLDKTNDKKNIGKYLLEITTKDNRTFKFYVLKDEQQKLYQHLLRFDNPKDTSIYYKFSVKYRESHPVNIDGWEMYDALCEYKRQGIDFEHNEDLQKKLKIVLNKNYYICETYPEILILPKGFSEEELLESRNFRTKNRIPVLSWINKHTGATLWRSSQTKGGITQQRCPYDEKLLKLIGELGGDRLIIFDARPYLNALANRLKGAGFENTDNYHNTEIHFLEIDNIHCVRNSLMKIHTLSRDPKIHENKKFLSTLEQTLWMDFIHLLIKSACEITSKLTKKNSVLIHCSDGWDRSTQLVTLTQILIDPYFRTIEGFIVLIEKDWLSFGHQFGMRSGIYNKDIHEENRAPIFLQWLDCIHQLLSQFKSSFEFNNELLLFLADHSNSYLYGTFLFNSDKERYDRNAKMKTVSIWSDVLENIEIYRNSFYSKESNFRLLFPNFSLYKLRFWEEYFLKYNLSYRNCQKKRLHNKSHSVSKSNCFYENNKKEDIITIDTQKKKIDSYENTLKLFYRNADTKKILEELSEEAKIILSELIGKDILEDENNKEEMSDGKIN